MDLTDTSFRLNLARQIKEAINDYWSEKRPNRQTVRISPSSLGEECAAQTYYRWRWATAPGPADGRMARYNSRGETNETDFVDWLRATGWNIFDKDEKGEQYSISDFGGHMYGKLDGIGNHPVLTAGVNLLIEFKYINARRFAALTAKALIEADFKYYCQTVIYMDYYNLPGCIFLPASRNDEDFLPVIIPADPPQAKLLKEKAYAIMTAKQRPARIAESPAFHKCKICDDIDVCHNGRPLAKSCRSCVQCVPVEGGLFQCNRWNMIIPNKEAIKTGCDEWTPVN